MFGRTIEDMKVCGRIINKMERVNTSNLKE